MAIKDTYSEILTEQIIQDILDEGGNPSTAEVLNRFEAFTEDHDISLPLFIANDYKVAYREAASASKWNNQNADIERDLRVLYRHLFKVSDGAINHFHRWRTEAALLEKKLTILEERINSLLFLSQDSVGFFNFVQDNFVDTSRVDLLNSTAFINVDKQMVTIATSTLGATRHDLTNLPDENVQFAVLSRTNLVSSVSSPESKLKYAITDINNYWQEKISTSKPGSVSAELRIDFGSEKEISRIDVDLHQSNSNSPLQITPFLSTDNYNFSELAIESFTRSILDKTSFQFSPVTARYVKFIMTKPGFDNVTNGLYVYEFGVDEISFYNEGFETGVEYQIISQPLSVLDAEGNIEEFSKVILEVCEEIPEECSIDYSIAAFDNQDESIDLLAFVGIDPINRETTTKPTVLDFGELNSIDVNLIGISYNPTAASNFVNPAQSFIVISDTTASAAVTYSGLASAPRYAFENSNERLLDHVLFSGINIANGTMELWRNISIQGDETKVRNVVNGWGFQEPYYQTTVYVENSNGVEIDFGGKAVIIDEVSYTGKVLISQGRHLIAVHKDNWLSVDNSLVTNLETLKIEDSLYPYNHRYLVEGYAYPDDWPDIDERIYRGFDVVAEFLCQQVSVFDLLFNVQSDDYEKFALAYDANDPSAVTDEGIGKEPMRSFLIKVDENNPDFIHEKFLLRFKTADSLFNYLRFKAILKTTSNFRTPWLDSYRIKISS